MDLLKREQVKYVFRPPRYSRALVPIFRHLSRQLFLKGRFKVKQVAIRGAEQVRALTDAGHMVLVAPNHADHADPHLLTYVGGRHGLPFHFMAAREVFEAGNAVRRWVFSRVGVFSVDREGRDLAAVKTAISVLQQGKHPLVIFPEGEIFHHHERLDPLNEGAATILLRAWKGRSKGQGAYLVPTALRYSYDPSVADTFSTRLDRLEERITWKPRPDLDPVARIYRLGSGLLAAKEIEFLGAAGNGALADRIAALQFALVSALEEEHLGKRRGGTVPERVRALRGLIRRELTESRDQDTERARKLYDDLDTLFVAVQLYSYPGQYLREAPSLHRIAETLAKLEEDVLGKAAYPASRAATALFGAPVDVDAFLGDGGLTAKTGIGPLTELLAHRIQAMLDEMV